MSWFESLSKQKLTEIVATTFENNHLPKRLTEQRITEMIDQTYKHVINAEKMAVSLKTMQILVSK